MPALAKMTYVEAKLLLRDPASAIMTLAFPLFLMTIFGIIPGFRKPFDGFNGQAVIDTFVPSVVVLVVLSILALSVMPVYLATYRERGVLRRLSASPVHPVKLLAAQIAVNTLMAIAAVVLLVAFAGAAFDVSPPADLGGFLLAFVLGTTTLLSLGMLVAAFAPSSKAATAIGLILMFPLMFLAGVWTPVEMLPGALGAVGRATPMGAVLQALRDSWGGDPVQPWLLLLMAGYSVAFAAISAKYFRWE
ncbi:ABC transporter permease [Streptomyces sp. NPDC048612]|uniref:ABC transporter permease n=1 Tax=Streptomyces sp. NPDC048612 TaxID=3365579 RepID=UPI003710FD8D